MEGILRSEEMVEIEQLYQLAFDFSKQVVYFPVRHHSPACSMHVKQVIAEYRPDRLFVEGPSEAGDLIRLLAAEETKPPFAIYYSYQDKEGYISEAKKEYKCYYPFLDYSPELNAFREAKRMGIPSSFIDLPYHEILIHSKEKEKQTYSNDTLLVGNDYLHRVCEKQGLRCFDELWEKFFEINGRNLSMGTFVKNMLTYCYLSRKNTSKEELEADGCLAREAYMAEQILKAKEAKEKILVVTGGFHTFGLVQLVAELEEKKEKKARVALHGKPQKCYLMAYSMEATDRLLGYASGMPYPAFYQEIWQAIVKKQENPYEETLLKLILDIGKRIRKKEGGLSTYDEICAYRMGVGLAALRGKQEPGAYELYDAVLSNFVKGEYNLSTQAPITVFSEFMTGKTIGVLCKEAEVPPLVMDFEKQCAGFGFKIHSTLSQEVTFDLFASEKHRRASCFLSRLQFLEVSFAGKTKGPSLKQKKNRNLIRETWKYKWHAAVVSELIDKSVYGATVEEAAETYLKEALSAETMDTGQAAKLLVTAFEMGLQKVFQQIVQRLFFLLSEEGKFFSLVECMDYLNMAFELCDLYHMDVGTELEQMIGQCFEKTMTLLPSMAGIKEEDSGAMMEACRLLYQLSRKEEIGRKERLNQAFETLLQREPIHPKLEGTVMGLLYGMDCSVLPRLILAVQGYMTGTHEKFLCMAGFMRGLFYGAKDLIFTDPAFLRQLDLLLRRVETEEFLLLVPELRLAFSYFTPTEIDEIAKQAASLYGTTKEELQRRKGVSPEIFDLGKELDTYTFSALLKYGLQEEAGGSDAGTDRSVK